MDFNKENIKKILLIIMFTVILFWGMNNLYQVMKFLTILIGILSPFITGLCIAFIINVPMRAIEKKLFKERSVLYNFKRPLSIIITIILVIAVIFIVMFLVIPEVGKTMKIIKAFAPSAILKMQNFVENMLSNNPEFMIWVENTDFNWQNITDTVMGFLKNGATSVLNSTFSIATSVFSGVFNFILGFIFSIYILLQKEKLGIQVKKIIYAYMPINKADRILYIGTVSEKIFSNFMTGQCLEAVILGILFFVGMSIFGFGFSYALMISVLIAFTALIPIFGAFIGCFVGIFLIAVAIPEKTIIFLIIFFVLQQIEGNFIYPKVVGNSVGLPSIWVLAAVTIGGSTFGVLGMLVMVPLSSVLYTLLREDVYKNLTRKNIRNRF